MTLIFSADNANRQQSFMPGLGPGIHVFQAAIKAWMAPGRQRVHARLSTRYARP